MFHPDFRGSLISEVETQKLQQISTSTESEIPLKGHVLKVRLFDLLEFCRFQKPVLLFHQVTNAPHFVWGFLGQGACGFEIRKIPGK